MSVCICFVCLFVFILYLFVYLCLFYLLCFDGALFLFALCGSCASLLRLKAFCLFLEPL